MASFIKLVYLIILLSIAIDFISLGNFLFNTDHDATAVQSSLLLPGAEAWVGPAIRAISKSARKAAKKRAKEAARKKGNARNKAKKAGGKEHTSGARKSTRNKHEKGQARQQREQSKSKKG